MKLVYIDLYGTEQDLGKWIAIFMTINHHVTLFIVIMTKENLYLRQTNTNCVL